MSCYCMSNKNYEHFSKKWDEYLQPPLMIYKYIEQNFLIVFNRKYLYNCENRNIFNIG